MDATLLIAAWGALVSTGLLVREIVLGVLEFSKERRRLKVTAFMGLEYGTRKNLTKSFVELAATNIGRRPITILWAGFWYSDKQGHRDQKGATQDLFKRVELPKRLEDGDHIDFALDPRGLQPRDDAFRFAAGFEDAEGTHYEVCLSKRAMQEIARWSELREDKKDRSRIRIIGKTQILK